MFKKFSISLHVARFLGSSNISIWAENGKLHYSKHIFDPESDSFLFEDSDVEDAISDVSLEDFVQNFEDLNIKKWRKSYEPIGYMVLDGEQWEIRLEFDEGKPINILGDNAYPREWNQLISLVRSVVGNTGVLETVDDGWADKSFGHHA